MPKISIVEEDADGGFDISESSLDLVQTPAPDSQNVKISSIHRHGDPQPHLIEACVQVASNITSSDIRVELKSDGICKFESEQWTDLLEVNLSYPVQPPKARVWVHDGKVTIRVPVEAI